MLSVFKPSSLLAYGFVATTASVGAFGLSETQFLDEGRSLVGGAYQRAFEDDFIQNVPLREASLHMWTALNLTMFGQTSDDIIVAGQDWLFTVEEFQEPDITYDFQTELSHAAGIVQAMGVQLVPVIIPDKARVYADQLPHSRGDAFETRYANALELLKKNGFPAIDLARVFSDLRTDTSAFMRTDTHWTPQAAQSAAREICEVLEIAVPANNPFVTTFSPAQNFEGDLMQFVSLGASWQQLGPRPETIEIPETLNMAGSDMLFDDIAVPLALVGSSYSARSEFNFAGFLQQAMGLELVNHAVEGRGPFEPMRELLASNTLLDGKPEIVVWEIPERYLVTTQ